MGWYKLVFALDGQARAVTKLAVPRRAPGARGKQQLNQVNGSRD
jgi:hypothetical protein